MSLQEEHHPMTPNQFDTFGCIKISDDDKIHLLKHYIISREFVYDKRLFYGDILYFFKSIFEKDNIFVFLSSFGYFRTISNNKMLLNRISLTTSIPRFGAQIDQYIISCNNDNYSFQIIFFLDDFVDYFIDLINGKSKSKGISNNIYNYIMDNQYPFHQNERIRSPFLRSVIEVLLFIFISLGNLNSFNLFLDKII